MCGRFSLSKTEKELETRFNARFYTEDLERYQVYDNYNVAPTHIMPVVVQGALPVIRMFRWGLIPSWSKTAKTAYNMINARGETIEGKNTYRKLINSHRCVVPMDGYYEWKRDGKARIPFYIHRKDHGISGAAGLWEHWNDQEGGESIHTFTIITQPAKGMPADIHDRMPLILDRETESWWLSEDVIQQNDIKNLMEAFKADDLFYYRVNAAVNKVQNNHPGLIEPEADQQTLF